MSKGKQRRAGRPSGSRTKPGTHSPGSKKPRREALPSMPKGLAGSLSITKREHVGRLPKPTTWMGRLWQAFKRRIGG